jgi:CRISPR-associated endonuclease/helicase Cas3
MLLAKSADAEGKEESLLDHSMAVARLSRKLFARLPSLLKEQERLEADLEAAAALHDVGKAASGFQEMLQGKKQNWNGWRHEVLSAAFASNLQVPEEVIFAILTHHQQIPGSTHAEGGNRLRWHANFPLDWPRIVADWQVNESLVADLWKQLCAELKREDLPSAAITELNGIALNPAWLNNKLFCPQCKGIPAASRLRASLLRGLLITSDHLASGGINDVPPPVDLRDFSPSFGLRDFQNRCAVTGNVILRAPTGSGKTEASLVWAAHNQAENGRFFYTLPHTAALNAMYGRLQDVFPQSKDSIGLLHGRAAHHLYDAEENDFPAERRKSAEEAKARARLAKDMYYPVRICTPHQLLRFTLRGQGWEQMLSEVPGSCIVFDEVHSYDPALAGLTLGTARLFVSMGASLMFISATLPRFLQEVIEKVIPCTAISPDGESKTDREILNRKRHIVRVVGQTLLELVPQIEAAVGKGLRVLVVCNHVRSAQRMARALRERLGEGEDRVCLFHGRFNLRDRKLKETSLASGTLPRVLVATQVVEVSLDISFDMGFFEAAPIDALAQRMGRVNRRGEATLPARIVVAQRSINRHRLYETARTDATVALLARQTEAISEQDLTTICDSVYQTGYADEDQHIFEQRLKFLANFETELIAGQHERWIEKVIENQDGRAEVLPIGLKPQYDTFVREKMWLDADALLVHAYVSGMTDLLDKDVDPWVVNLPYGSDGLLPRE